jgi:thymidylate kinase
MTPSSEENEFLRVALAAIPRTTEMIAAFPAEHRAGALEMAKRRYMQAAAEFGCTTVDSERAVDAVMRELQAQVEQQAISQGKLTSLLRRLTSATQR